MVSRAATVVRRAGGTGGIISVEVEAGALPLPGGAVTLVAARDLQQAEVEERDLRGLGEQGDP